MRISLFILLAFCTVFVSAGQAQPAKKATRNYITTPTGYLMVLQQGDNVLQELEQLTQQEAIPSASITGLGFVHPTFGFWNAATKTYDPKALRDTELVSLTGSIAWQDNKPALHLHGVVADKEFRTTGGHILALEVGTGSVEITIIRHPDRLVREIDPKTGAAVLQIPNR
ncbi:hypothetical protein GGR92_000054 [Spirosoma lacussanchae]|uniref:PPC domain-containing DNA-binding protein n=1 Tax=Spirosoma lacussanchae TaxID=1884249 RepID=UPI0014865DA3|nr:PPC domain-containing DNA-binding protein [Spirosoma lacussanchae]